MSQDNTVPVYSGGISFTNQPNPGCYVGIGTPATVQRDQVLEVPDQMRALAYQLGQAEEYLKELEDRLRPILHYQDLPQPAMSIEAAPSRDICGLGGELRSYIERISNLQLRIQGLLKVLQL